MKVGDLIRWIGTESMHLHDGKYGLVIDRPDLMFFEILWQDGVINRNIEKQMMVVREAR